ncbi:MAG: efflux RND transporter periplasmic adaptor subunit [Acidobacteriota bacterium]
MSFSVGAASFAFLVFLAFRFGVLGAPRPAVTEQAIRPTIIEDTIPPNGAPSECYLAVIVARHSIDVVARSEGQLERLLVEIGSEVEEGTVLARLETVLIEHELAIERASLEASSAEANRWRQQALRARAETQRREALTDVLSKEELARSVSEAEEAEAQVAASEAVIHQAEARIARLQTQLDRAEIRAPFAGTVATRYVDPGAVVLPGTPILRLISARDRQARFAVPMEEKSDLKLGEPVRVEILGIPPMSATVLQIAPEIDAASQMVFAQAQLDEASETVPLVAGTTARVSRIGTEGSCW